MALRGIGVVGVSLGLLCMPSDAWSQVVHPVVRTAVTSVMIEDRSIGFFVHFSMPVDHPHSSLAIVRDGKVMATLHPRLEAAPNVLYARAPTPPAGDYTLHWIVRPAAGMTLAEGDVPFTVGTGGRDGGMARAAETSRATGR
jgi:hypothetical protein